MKEKGRKNIQMKETGTQMKSNILKIDENAEHSKLLY